MADGCPDDDVADAAGWRLLLECLNIEISKPLRALLTTPIPIHRGNVILDPSKTNKRVI